MKSRDWRRTRLGARRTLYRTLAIVPGSGRGGRFCAISASGARGNARRGPARHRLVVRVAEIAHLAKILGGETRVHRAVEALLGEIPTPATRHPGRLGEPALNVLVMAQLNVFAHIQIAQVVVEDGADAAHRVLELALDVDQQRVMTRPGIGSGHEE